MSTVQAIKIPVEGDIELVSYERDDISFINNAVGGYFECIQMESQPITLWTNETGKIDKLPTNRKGTLLLWLDQRWRWADMIMGDILITGNADDDGNTLSVPSELVALIFGTVGWKYEVQTGSDDWNGNQRTFDDFFEAINGAIDLERRWTLVTDVRVVPA